MLGVRAPFRHVLPFGGGKVGSKIPRLAVAVDPFDQRGPIAERAVHHVTVAASPDPEKAAPMQRAAPPFDLAGAEEARRDVLDRGRRRLLHAEVDILALARGVAG